MATKLLAKNTTFTIAGTGGTLVKISGVKDFTFNGGASSTIDSTDLDSVAKEKLSGLPDEGTVDLTIDWIPTDVGQLAIDAARLTGLPTEFKVTLSTGAVYDMRVLVKSAEKSGQVDQLLMLKTKFEITGPITVTPATGS